MALLQVAKLHGLELLPRLDDIPELKKILTPGVLIILKERYEIPEKKIYTSDDVKEYLERYRILYTQYECDFGETYDYIIFEKYRNKLRTKDFVNLVKSETSNCDGCVCVLIIPLRINKSPFSKEERELLIQREENKKTDFLNGLISIFKNT